MESKNKISYDVDKSSDRMDEILDANNSNYSDRDHVPARSTLTYNNGYYVNVTALFIDIVGSSDMTDEHLRPTLAKIYRSFISESVAIMNAEDCRLRMDKSSIQELIRGTEYRYRRKDVFHALMKEEINKTIFIPKLKTTSAHKTIYSFLLAIRYISDIIKKIKF